MVLKKSPQQGVAILFAVLLVSTVLAISLTLLNITYRQLLLSSTVRESQLAFYAADSALNCARHWDSFVSATNPFGYFFLDETGQHFAPPVNGNSSRPLVCGSGGVIDPFDGATNTNHFRLYLDLGIRTLCAEGQVIKDQTTFSTKIRVQGYSAGGNLSSCPATVTDRTLERAIEYGPY